MQAKEILKTIQANSSMKIFEIDVSGSDLFSPPYTICVSDNEKIIKAIKFNNNLVLNLKNNFKNRLYPKYLPRRRGQTPTKYERKPMIFKIRLYCLAVYFIFESFRFKLKNPISINLCRDFDGTINQAAIINNLNFLLKEKLNLDFDYTFVTLPSKSFAHQYAYKINNAFSEDLKRRLLERDMRDFEKFLC